MSMHRPQDERKHSPRTDYESLGSQAYDLLKDEPDFIANSANFASLVYHGMSDVNWCGFYFKRGADLVLGPFCGKPACTRIALGQGVCGKAAAQRQTLAVDDVGSFAGHIACDTASQSEIVVPLLRGDELIGVFDLDSARLARFTLQDKVALEELVHVFMTVANPPEPLIHEPV